MNFYLDFEFHEGFHKPLFGIKRHFIDPISIGIVNDKGEEYYAVFNDFDIKAAWNSWQPHRTPVSGGAKNHWPCGYIETKEYWLRENVLKTLFEDMITWFVSENEYKGSVDLKFDYDNFKYLIKKYGKSREDVKVDILKFICPYETASDYAVIDSIDDGYRRYLKLNPPAFYGYFCDYDWVCFASLFGKMINLPDGFPYYCIDLKQMFDQKAAMFSRSDFFTAADFKGERLPDLSLEEKIKHLKMHTAYPSQENEHLAIADARWNKQLHDFLKTI